LPILQSLALRGGEGLSLPLNERESTMNTDEQTCAQRIDEKLKGREEDLRALLDNPDSDWGQDDPALSIQKREIVEICLSWGGPADYVEIHLTEGEVDKVLYRFSDWFDTATVEIEKDSPLYTYAMFSLEMMSQ
jgi:hypothetical protein